MIYVRVRNPQTKLWTPGALEPTDEVSELVVFVDIPTNTTIAALALHKQGGFFLCLDMREKRIVVMSSMSDALNYMVGTCIAAQRETPSAELATLDRPLDGKATPLSVFARDCVDEFVKNHPALKRGLQ